jgi:hypothetical protein
VIEKNSYAPFAKLEIRLKIALAFYILFLLSGMVVLGFGVGNVTHYSEMPHPGFFFLASLAALVIFLVTIFSLNKMYWLSKLHMWLDRQLFGFLNRSNDTILLSLLSALKPEEQKLAARLEPTKKNSIGQSIFAALSNDPELSQRLLHSGIFPMWTWYWITIYGTLTFTILTVAAFFFVVASFDIYTNSLFSIYWVLAIVHVFLAVVIGFKLIRMSRATMKNIVESHRDQIAAMLEKNISQEEETT